MSLCPDLVPFALFKMGLLKLIVALRGAISAINALDIAFKREIDWGVVALSHQPTVGFTFIVFWRSPLEAFGLRFLSVGNMTTCSLRRR